VVVGYEQMAWLVQHTILRLHNGDVAAVRSGSDGVEMAEEEVLTPAQRAMARYNLGLEHPCDGCKHLDAGHLQALCLLPEARYKGGSIVGVSLALWNRNMGTNTGEVRACGKEGKYYEPE